MVVGWRTRVRNELSALPKRSLLECNRESGIEIVVGVARHGGIPVVSIWTQEPLDEDSLCTLLISAIKRALGSDVCRGVETVSSASELLNHYQKSVGPICLILGWIEHLNCHLTTLLGIAGPASDVVAICESARNIDVPSGFHVQGMDCLKMTPEEALIESRGLCTEIEAARMLVRSGRHYVSFASALYRLISGHDSQSVDPVLKGGDIIAQGQTIDALVARSMWALALDRSCIWAPEKIPPIVDEIGKAFSASGEYEHLLSRLASCPPEVREDPRVFYWLFAAAAAVGQHWAWLPGARRILQEHEAPELRAAVAIAHPGRDMVSETSRALRAHESPITLRAHGFALGMAGERDIPLVMFREAMRLADLQQAHNLVVACGIDIAQLELRRGRYLEAVGWSKWALSELHRRGVGDHTRRLSAIATLAYLTVMTGDHIDAEEMLKDCDPSLGNASIPGLEGLVSTLGDVALLVEKYDLAHTLYQAQYESAPVEVSAFASLNLVVLELARGNQRDAESIAEVAFAVGSGGSEHERAIGWLVRGMVLASRGAREADSALITALDLLVLTSVSIHIAQAAIWLALSRHSRHETASAVAVLRANAVHVDGLSESGWQLLGAKHAALVELRNLYFRSKSTLGIRFLGSQSVTLHSGQKSLSVRQAEILALLAQHPQGLTAEKLHNLQYGGEGEAQRTKVAVSRLRKILPISSSPYRIDLPFRADFLEVLNSIEDGNLQRALNLYSGELLPNSDAPAIVELRIYLEEALRRAVLRSKDSDALIQLGTILDNDIEVWLAARESLTQGDYRHAAITARISRIRASW